MRPKVNDLFSITAQHYINGGHAALLHLSLLVNTIISNIENASCSILNTVHAHILHKGHNKDKSLDTSYRTISTCPLVAKILDTYVRELSSHDWDSVQAETQFQGKGLSHEHSALLLTEAINHALSEEKKPVFALYLDARSAFDKVIFSILCRCLYLDGTRDQNLGFIIRRLENIITFCEWDREIMGPIIDELGVEQGGVNSSDFYKIYNNEQLSVPQETGFGVLVGDVHVAAIGQADDTVLISSDIHKLKFLLHLTLQYCKKYNVELSATKTKLQLFTPAGYHIDDAYLKAASSLSISGTNIKFVTTTEHVGILRSTTSSLAKINFSQ